MATGKLSIDLPALAENWRALARASGAAEAGAVVKADGYGLGAARVARTLADTGARRFFVAVASEGVVLRDVLGPGPEILVFSGHMAGDTRQIRDAGLTPLINSPEQLSRHRSELDAHPFGVQLDTGMNRLGAEADEWSEMRAAFADTTPVLVMSHLACADEPGHPMNRDQLEVFRSMTEGLGCARSLSATGGILLGPDFHFDITRPGIGLYGGLPFAQSLPVVTLVVPVIQVRDLAPGETVGYGNAWTANRPSRIATVSAGYADGLIRAMGAKARVFFDGKACPVVGRVSMDLITVDVTDLDRDPDTLEILGSHQRLDDLAEAAGTIGYEILTSLGARYERIEA